MRILVDSDILLDVAFDRRPFTSNSAAVLDWCEEHPGQGFIAWHTLSNVDYILRRGPASTNPRQFLRDLLVFMEVAVSGTAAAKQALALPMKDFEDALQAAAAVEAAADYIITRNTGHYRLAPIPAVLPGAFLELTSHHGSD